MLEDFLFLPVHGDHRRGIMKFVRGTILILFFILLSGNLCAYVYYVKEGGSGAGTGADWDNALPSVQSAIDLADFSATGDAIYVAEGTYEEQ
jgi:hypothetical protein